MIPQQYIDEVIARANIIDVIDARVKLKKSGKSYVACCPFHDEKTPSFSASEEKQFYYCFGCGASGDAIGFLVDYERLDFKDAVISLGRSIGLEDPEPQARVKESDQARFNRYAAIKRKMADDNLLMAIVKSARERGEPIPESDKPIILDAIKTLKDATEEIKKFADVEIAIKKSKLHQELVDSHMTLICKELQEDRDLHFCGSVIPNKVPKVTEREAKIAKNRIEKLSKAIG